MSINKINFKSVLRGFILLSLIIATTGCSTNFLTARKDQTFQFNQDINNKTRKIISPDKVYDLESCINIALENNLEIRIAEINGRLSGLDRKIAFSYFLPHIDINFTFNHILL